MKKLFITLMALVSLSAFAHYAVFLLGQVVNASGNVTVSNNLYSGKVQAVEFTNLGTQAVIVHHMRFLQPQEAMILSANELTVGPGETVKEVFSDYPVILRSVQFYVEGQTELLEVHGIIP